MPEDSSARDVIAGVMQLANLLSRRLGPLFEKAHITPQQFAVLLALSESGGPTTLAGLARLMRVSKQNMTGVAARLEQNGYIDRGNDPSDLRSAKVVLTRRGKTLVEKLRPAYDEWLRALGRDVDAREMHAFEETLRRLIAELS